MHNNTERILEIITNTFSDYLMKKIDNHKLEERISTSLSNIEINGKVKNFEVSIVSNNHKEPFFGMRIFPIISDSDIIVKALVNDKKSFKEIYQLWKEIKNFYIEIDSQCFDRNSVNFIPQELTALIIHELGHVVYSESSLEVFYRAYQEAYMRMKIAEKASLKFLYLLYTIPLSASCMLRNWVNGKNEIKVEMFADSFLKEYNYSEFLISAIGKIIKNFGNSALDSTDVQKDSKIEESVNWCNLNIVDLTRRKNRLKDDLFFKTVKTNSNYIKALMMKVLTDLGIKMHETYTGAVVESTIERILEKDSIYNYNTTFDLKKIGLFERAIENAMNTAYDIALESHSNKTMKPPSQYDIDTISVEADRIENHNDRIYVLDLIYHRESEINEFIEIIEKDPLQKKRYYGTCTNMIEQLENIRKVVLSKKSFNKNYKVFVKYPEGYEG